MLVKFDPHKLSIRNFKILKGQIENPESFDLQKIVGYEVENSFELGFNFEDNLVKADFTVDIKTDSAGKNQMEASGNFHVVFIFFYQELNEMAKPVDTEQIILNPEFANSLASITYSTCRGVFLTRFQGTALQKFILPITNTNSLLNKTPTQ